ncbi:helix-turn-helix domain-containing protein [Moorella sp. Hama-1]|uniref:helix-turn-helix domain-containing protein n=1 Tax=Moorella sp. Hama-1 TaxID=2138101 RepID=UPI00137A49D0|nr:helix-turn-helix transcriptional regulator [Moorella sp. Hama-1]BCV20426.1 hypothetical protein hamaS1_04950 [Moorella sp. Hama-1]
MIGAMLWQLRKQQNYSLRALAQATGLSHSFICDVEHGRSNPSIETLQVLAQALGVTPDIFFKDDLLEETQPDQRPLKRTQSVN